MTCPSLYRHYFYLLSSAIFCFSTHSGYECSITSVISPSMAPLGAAATNVFGFQMHNDYLLVIGALNRSIVPVYKFVVTATASTPGGGKANATVTVTILNAYPPVISAP